MVYESIFVRSLDYESRGQEFESSRAHQNHPWTMDKCLNSVDQYKMELIKHNKNYR